MEPASWRNTDEASVWLVKCSVSADFLEQTLTHEPDDLRVVHGNQLGSGLELNVERGASNCLL